MSYTYLIKIDKEIIEENDTILKYIMDQINQDNMVDKINEIKCVSSKDIVKTCREKILELGKINKQKELCIDTCTLCLETFNIKQFIFKFNACKHQYHKKCINKFLKRTVNIICPCCKELYLHNIVSII